MDSINRSRETYFLDKLLDQTFGEEASEQIRAFLSTEHIYVSATREIVTKLENLNDEFKYSQHHNPIHQVTARVKTPRRIVEKLARKGHEMTLASARQNIHDIAGVRVICSYVDDLYLVATLLTSQSDIELIREIDYIKNPKPNGYRSLHLIIAVPVFMSSGPESVKVEIQLRTIAMDFWASLEHELAYRLADKQTEQITRELKDCADVISATDMRMQKLYNAVIQSGLG
ncbi:MAG: GTP pyrophosphokinase family protein [candidate division Zixibacteria bacterium]|jgi:putative GTP pyrophosphokinase|nr:GTP pyrophosphokinase family protein [candidate division Zixibacteria bacterium]